MVTCQICNKQFRVISNTHLKRHDMTQKQYSEKFPGVVWKDEELNIQQSIFMKKRWQDPVYYEEMKQLNVGSKRSEETKEKMSLAKLGENNPNYGKICTPEETEFRRYIASNWERTPEYREKLSKAGIGKVITEEQKQKQSIKQKQNWASGVYDGVFQSPTLPEINLMAALNALDIKYIPQYRIGTYLYDAYLPNYDTLIEYDGWHWHFSEWAITQTDSIERMAIKDELAVNANLNLIRLKGLPNYDLTYDEIYSELGAILCPV